MTYISACITEFGKNSFPAAEKKKPLCVCEAAKPSLQEAIQEFYANPPAACPASFEPVKMHDDWVKIGKGDNRILFHLEAGVDVNESDLQKMRQMHALITEVNQIIPSQPIREVHIVPELDESGYDENHHEISVHLDEYFLDITAHEMGHAVFKVFFGEKMFGDEDWAKLYALALNSKNYEILDESYYMDAKNMYGHPMDNATELFASAIVVYKFYADELLEKIQDPATDTGQKKLALQVFSYLKHEVFNGEYYSECDPVGQTCYGISDKAAVDSLLKTLKEKDPESKEMALRAIGGLGIQDQRFIDPLIEALSDRSPYVRASAAKTIGELGIKDSKFVDPLVKALNDSEHYIRWAAATSIGDLGMEESKFINALIRVIEDGKEDVLVREAAAESLGKIGDGDALFALIRVLANGPQNSLDYFFKKEAQEAIKEIEDRLKTKVSGNLSPDDHS